MTDREPTPGETLWALILADDPAEIARLEEIAEASQAEAVDYIIERSCWSVDVPAFVGHKGTRAARLAAVRAVYRADRDREKVVPFPTRGAEP